MARWLWVGIWMGLLGLVGCDRLSEALLKGSVLFTDSHAHLLLGNPSNATADLNQPDNYLMEKPQYVLSYNRSRGIPNWVSWQLNQSWLGAVPRRNEFQPDDALPADWHRVFPSDYNGSGYDRGHVMPSGDRTNTPENNTASFLMTNIFPQTPDNNRGPWEGLESYCRSLVKEGKELYIVAGGYGAKRAIAGGKLLPPTHTWKVVVVLDSPGLGLGGVTSQTRVIAVTMPNTQGIKTMNWRSFRVAVNEIEAATGYDFLSTVPKDIQRSLESRVDSQ
jgi:endonuclease G, mitochondrial